MQNNDRLWHQWKVSVKSAQLHTRRQRSLTLSTVWRQSLRSCSSSIFTHFSLFILMSFTRACSSNSTRSLCTCVPDTQHIYMHTSTYAPPLIAVLQIYLEQHFIFMDWMFFLQSNKVCQDTEGKIKQDTLSETKLMLQHDSNWRSCNYNICKCHQKLQHSWLFWVFAASFVSLYSSQVRLHHPKILTGPTDTQRTVSKH